MAPSLSLSPPPRSPSSLPSPTQLYEPFYEDFGPLNLGKTHKFIMRTHQLLQVRERLMRLFSVGRPSRRPRLGHAGPWSGFRALRRPSMPMPGCHMECKLTVAQEKGSAALGCPL